jgi:predicted permease
MINIFDTILPIFLLLTIGKIMKTYWLTSSEFWRGMEKFSYFILFPSAIFNYIVHADLNSRQVLGVVSILILASSIVLCGLWLYKKHYAINGKVFTSMVQGSIRYNNYMFFGIGSMLYKDEGLSMMAIVALYLIVFTNVVSILAFNIFVEKDSEGDYFENMVALIKKFTLNPMICASLLALTFNQCEIKIGASLTNLLKNLSSSALSVGIITVGSGLVLSFRTKEQLNSIVVSATSKLFVLPIITYLLLTMFKIDGMLKEIALLHSCMPCATTSYVLSKQLNGDYELMASIITVTTIFSVLSLSILMYILV